MQNQYLIVDSLLVVSDYKNKPSILKGNLSLPVVGKVRDALILAKNHF